MSNIADHDTLGLDPTWQGFGNKLISTGSGPEARAPGCNVFGALSRGTRVPTTDYAMAHFCMIDPSFV